MHPGDLVYRIDYDGEINYHDIGILLDVKPAARRSDPHAEWPWQYEVLWGSGQIKFHEMGTLRRFLALRGLR
jgi:hypothetical protein